MQWPTALVSQPMSLLYAPWNRYGRPVYARVRQYAGRRPHRSFRRTRRRDYVRTMALPGYWSFTNYVRNVLWSHRGLFGREVASFGLVGVLLLSVATQTLYTDVQTMLRDPSAEALREIDRVSILLSSLVSGLTDSSATDSGWMYAFSTLFLAWLTTVWLIRAVSAGKQPRFRDGLYNAGAPIVATLAVGMLMIIQLLPASIATVGVVAALPAGIMDYPGLALMFWAIVTFLYVLSLYWLTGSLIATVIVTLPGMYPWQAVRLAGDIVTGRRFRILLRLGWMMLAVIVAATAVVYPLMLFDAWLKQAVRGIEWIPIVPAGVICMGVAGMVWCAAYVYLLYRRIVEDESQPA